MKRKHSDFDAFCDFDAPSYLLTRREAIALVNDGVLAVPEGKTVLDADFAFFLVRSDMPRVQKLIIPASVTDIMSMRGDLSSGPFGYAGNPFSEIVVARRNKRYASEDGVLFTKDMNTLLCYPCGKPGSEYRVPDKVGCIRTDAFMNAEHLERIIFPDPMPRIEHRAFNGCERLDFPDAARIYGSGGEYIIVISTLGLADEPENICYLFLPEAEAIEKTDAGYLREFTAAGGVPVEDHDERVGIMRAFAEESRIYLWDREDDDDTGLRLFIAAYYSDPD